MTDAIPFPAAVPLQDYSTMIGTSSTQVLAPGVLKPGVRYVHFENSGQSNGWIWWSFTGPAAVNAPGSYPLPPSSEKTWSRDIVPAMPIYAVSTVSNTLMTVIVG